MRPCKGEVIFGLGTGILEGGMLRKRRSNPAKAGWDFARFRSLRT